jgi:hypothetical protein
MIEERVEELKAIIAGNDGRNAADWRFARMVDELVDAVFDDVSQVKRMPARALFDLFIIKVLYVGRRSRDAQVLEYLGGLLESSLSAARIFPPGPDGRPRRPYFSDALGEAAQGEGFESAYEAYRTYGDSALFLSGMFPRALGRRRSSRSGAVRRGGGARTVDRAYYVTTGKAMYRLAADDREAERQRIRAVLLKLAEYFEVYVDALNEISERYVMGFDADLIADKMLDSFNAYRASGEARALENARRYASILRVDRARFPSLFGGDAPRTV